MALKSLRSNNALEIPCAGIGGLASFAEAVVALGSWRRSLAAFACGAASVLAMAPFYASPVLFLTLPVLVWLIDVATSRAGAGSRWTRLRKAAGVGWWFGFGYHLAGLFWIGEAFLVEADKFGWLMPFAVTLLPAGLALFTALATTAASLAWRPGWPRVLALALALALAEWLRGHILTGFPWNVLGYALTQPLVLMQSAAVFGIYGLTLLAVLAFASPLVLWADAEKDGDGAWRRFIGAGVSLGILAALAIFGAVSLATPAPAPVAGVRLRLVQPSIPQREKWRPEKQRDIFVEHLQLSAQAADGVRDELRGITHVIWPEAAMPFLPLDTPVALEAIARLLPDGVQLLAGALRVEAALAANGRRKGFNSLIVLDDKAALAGLYDKIHLVPFGEYLPAQETLESIGLEQLTRWRGGFSFGRAPRPLLAVAGLPPIAVLICYEAIFPAAVVQGAERPGLLLNVTNDGWFGNTTGPHQHFHEARVRAVEEGLPLVRAANNGISAIVDSKGRVLASLGLNTRGVLDGALPGAGAPTLYARYGDALFAGVWILGLAGLLWPVARQHSSPHAGGGAS